MEDEEVSDEEDVYEVEKIVDDIMAGGKTFYRVRWKNYGEDGDTWEPRDNLLSCEDLLNNYIRMHTEKATGMSLPSDVFTAGSDEENSSDVKSTSTGSKKVNLRGQKGKKKEKVVKKQTKKTSRIIEDDYTSSSSEEPQIKDDFYEKLAEGKIDVFAFDMYSKVKKRRPPEKETDEPQENLPMQLTGKGKKRGPKKKSEDKDTTSNTDPKVINTDTGTEKVKKRGRKSGKKQQIPETSSDDHEVPIQDSMMDMSSDDGESTEVSKSSNVVLEYLESEIKNTKTKKKKKDSDTEKTKKISVKNKKHDHIEKEVSKPLKEGSAEKKKVDEDDISSDVTKSGSVFENLSISERSEESVLDPWVKDSNAKILEPAEFDKEKKKKKKTKKLKEGDTGTSVGDKMEEPEKEPKNVKEKSSTKYEEIDAFSALLQESDSVSSERIFRKKEKGKKSKSTPKPSSSSSAAERGSTSQSQSVFEMLSQEMANNDSGSSIETNVNQNAIADKEVPHVSRSSKLSSNSEKVGKASCLPEMAEFLKIKVNFELDEISLKDIEKHHEMSEPPCRLERDITNGEFRQHIRQNNFEMVYEALKSKKMMYNLEHTDSAWMTQLMVAATEGYDEIVKILAHHGAKVNARNKNGQTSLMFAAEKGHDIICKILIAYGAYINLQTTQGETALMKAAKNGNMVIVRYLLQAGADPTLKSTHGATAHDIAERGHHIPLTSLIKEHELNINAHMNECIHRELLSLGIKTIGLPILATRMYNIRESPLVHINFNCVLQSVPPNQGVVLFAVHGMIGSGLSIKCRMRGPCYVQAVTLNNFVMDPMMPGKSSSDEYTHFMCNLIWRTGQNSLKLFVSQDALCNEKLLVAIIQCGFQA